MSRTAVSFLDALDDRFWLDVAEKSPEATFFHTPLWRDLAVKSFPGHSDASVGIRLKDGTCAVLPLLETGRSARGLLRDAVSTFGGCYGGLIADRELSDQVRTRILAAALRRQRVGSLQMTENPLAPFSGLPPRFESTPSATHLLALDDGWERVFSRLSRGTRSGINRGRKLGIDVRVAGTLEEYRAYFGVYEASLARWAERATSRYPRELFENGFALGRRHPDHLRLWLAGMDGKVMAGAWVFYWNRYAVYWHGATDVAYSTCRPANVLHAAIVEDACARGYRHYDFNPSGGHEGVSRFKSGFGGAVVPIRFLSYRSATSGALRSMRRLLS